MKAGLRKAETPPSTKSRVQCAVTLEIQIKSLPISAQPYFNQIIFKCLCEMFLGTCLQFLFLDWPMEPLPTTKNEIVLAKAYTHSYLVCHPSASSAMQGLF